MGAFLCLRTRRRLTFIKTQIPTIMFQKHAEIQITRGTAPLGNSLRVGESPRVVTSIKQGGGRRGGDNRRVTRTDTARTGGVTRFNTGALNTGGPITGGNIGGGNIT